LIIQTLYISNNNLKAGHIGFV